MHFYSLSLLCSKLDCHSVPLTSSPITGKISHRTSSVSGGKQNAFKKKEKKEGKGTDTPVHFTCDFHPRPAI